MRTSSPRYPILNDPPVSATPAGQTALAGGKGEVDAVADGAPGLALALAEPGARVVAWRSGRVACAPPHAMTEQVTSRETVGLRMGRSYVPDCTIARLDPVHGPSSRAPAHPRSGAMRTTRRPTRRSSPSRESPRETSISPPQVRTNLVGGLYHFGRSVSDLARAFRLMGEGAYDRLHARQRGAWGPRADPRRSRGAWRDHP
jgi:hypothetical protein